MAQQSKIGTRRVAKGWGCERKGGKVGCARVWVCEGQAVPMEMAMGFGSSLGFLACMKSDGYYCSSCSYE
jgi:hypothetical protein